MNINFGMDNFYVRYLKRFLNSEFQQTNTILGEFNRDDQKFLIQYLNTPNVETMAIVQKEINTRFPRLKELFIRKVYDDRIVWTSTKISMEASTYIREIVDDMKDYCKSVGWNLVDAHEWVDELMDINNDGVIDQTDRQIIYDLVYNDTGMKQQKGRIAGRLVCPDIVNWELLKPDISVYDSYNQLVKKAQFDYLTQTYVFTDLDDGIYKVIISPEGYLDTTINSISVKMNNVSKIKDIEIFGGYYDNDNKIDILDLTIFNDNMLNSYDVKYDINKDGIIDGSDGSILKKNYNKKSQSINWMMNFEEMVLKNKYPPEIVKKADINLDGVIDIEDMKLFDKYLASGKLTIEIKKDNRKNFFPNEDMKVFVNQFDGTFLYEYAIRDGIGVDNIPHKNASGLYKVALYECKPNQKITIAHNNTRNTKLIIGSSPARLKQDVTSFMLQDVEEVYLNPGDYYEYQTSGSEKGTYDAHWVCIQCPSSYGNLSGTSKQTITLELGDVNFDGRVDMEDYKLISYYTATGANAEQYHWKATPKQLAAMDIYKDGKIDNRCARAVWDYIHGTWGGVNLGLNEFTCDVASDYGDIDNVGNLLIIDGWYEKEVGIPFLEFAQGDGWIIHEKFFNYLLNMAVTKYSNSESITFVQEMLKNYYSHTFFDTDFLKVGIYNQEMRDMMKEYQRKHVEYTYGDLDLDGKLTEKDLVILREYIYSFSDDDARTPITLADLRNYLDNGITLTTTQQKWADVNRDGIIDEQDYQLLRIYKGDKELTTKVEQYLKKEYSLTPDEFKLADMNKDNIIDEEDLKKLQSYPRVLNGRQLEHAYIKHDKIIDTDCYDILESNINGTSDNLRIYQIPFALGWYDVQTEYFMESEYNVEELISEVSK